MLKHAHGNDAIELFRDGPIILQAEVGARDATFLGTAARNGKLLF
jgi:hypothetical protein